MRHDPVLNPLSPHAPRAASAVAAALIASITGARQAVADSDARLAIETVSNRADLVSGGGARHLPSDAPNQERYQSHAGFVRAVTKAANELVKERFLLEEDANAFIDAAQTSDVLR
jgi:alpha/beta hydrolase family protein